MRLRRWSAVACTLVTLTGLSPAADPPAAGEKWLADRALTVTPAPEPRPALKYRLLPLASELKEGNAVPIYLRLIHEQNDAARKYWTETPRKWNELPLDRVPLDEARKFLGPEHMERFLQQFDYGARRKTAEWNYTLEQPDPIGILLPDAQSMRNYTPMLVLRARVAVAEGNYAEAARAFETGFGFGRHVANGPFLINSLVGMAIAHQFLDRIPEWIERPDAPNLYWSLTALPWPLVDLRKQLEFEQRVAEWQFPDLADLDRPRTAGEWDAALKRYRAEFKRISPMFAAGEGNKGKPPVPVTDPDEPAAKSPHLAAARAFVAERLGKSADEVAKMPPAQVLLLDIAGRLADHRDDLFKVTYLPFAQGHQRAAAAVKRLETAGDTEGDRLAKEFLPAVAKVMVAQNRLERKVALLRAVEAVRLHAAAHGGRLPDSLEQITVVPVPLDPGTGKAFEYSRDGATATLASRLPGEPLEGTGLRYRVTIRK